MQRAVCARPGSLTAYELGLRAMAAAWAGMVDASDRALPDEALRVAREALAIDPRCSAAWHAIAFAQWEHINLGTATSTEQAIREGVDACQRALAVNVDDHVALMWKGILLLMTEQHGTAILDLRRAHEINPNDAFGLAMLAWTEAISGNARVGIDCALRALRLSPRDPVRYIMLNVIGWAHAFALDYSGGAHWASLAISSSPRLPAPRHCLVICLVGLGDIERARAEFVILRDLAPAYIESRLAGRTSMYVDMQLRTRLVGFLRIAARLEDLGAADALC